MSALRVTLNFAWSRMGFEIFTDNVTASVNCEGSVADAVFGFIARIDEEKGIASFGSFTSFT